MAEPLERPNLIFSTAREGATNLWIVKFSVSTLANDKLYDAGEEGRSCKSFSPNDAP